MTSLAGEQREQLHTVAEAAALLRVHPSTVRTLYGAGHLRIARVGRLVRVPDSALREYLAATTTTTTERTAP